MPDEITVGIKLPLEQLYKDLKAAHAAVIAEMKALGAEYPGAVRGTAKTAISTFGGKQLAEPFGVTISGRSNVLKDTAKTLQESIRTTEHNALEMAKIAKANKSPALMRQAIKEQDKIFSEDIKKVVPTATFRRIESNFNKYTLALNKMTEDLASKALREQNKRTMGGLKGAEQAAKEEENQRAMENRIRDANAKNIRKMEREQALERAKEEQARLKKQFKTQPQQALLQQQLLESATGTDVASGLLKPSALRNVRKQREWMEETIVKEQKKTADKDKARMEKRNDILDEINTIEEKATKRASVMGRRKMIAQEQLIKENEYFQEKEKTLSGKYRDLIAQGYSPARAAQEVTNYQRRVKAARMAGQTQFNQNVQDMGREYAAASEDDKRRLRKQKAYRQLPQVQADIAAAEQKQMQVNAMRDARLAKKERERQGSQQIMGLASAGIGLFGTPGFALLNVAFASMSGLKYAGIAAVATAIGETVRGLNSMADAARQSAESLGLMTKEFKISKMEFEAVKALWGQAMEGAEQRKIDYLKTFLETPRGMKAGSFWANLRTEFISTKLPAQVEEQGGFLSLKNLIPGFGAKVWLVDPLMRAIKGYREDIDPMNRERQLGNAIFEMRKQMLPFQSAIEKPEDMWRRMQVAFASVQDTQILLAQRALEVAEKQLKQLERLNEPQKEREFQEAAFGFYMP